MPTFVTVFWIFTVILRSKSATMSSLVMSPYIKLSLLYTAKTWHLIDLQPLMAKCFCATPKFDVNTTTEAAETTRRRRDEREIKFHPETMQCVVSVVWCPQICKVHSDCHAFILLQHFSSTVDEGCSATDKNNDSLTNGLFWTFISQQYQCQTAMTLTDTGDWWQMKKNARPATGQSFVHKCFDSYGSVTCFNSAQNLVKLAVFPLLLWQHFHVSGTSLLVLQLSHVMWKSFEVLVDKHQITCCFWKTRRRL